MNGYFRMPRSLTRTLLWKDATPEVKVIFLTILDHVLFVETQFDDHGKILTLFPGQFCASLEEIARLCGRSVTKSDVQRGLIRLEKFGFLKQEVIHVKTVLTITHKDTYDLIYKAGDTKYDPRVMQERYRNETQRENEMNEEKKQNIAQSTELLHNKTVTITFSFEKRIFENILEIDMRGWEEAYPAVNVRKELPQMVEWCLGNPTKAKSKKLWRKFITNWLAKRNEENINKQARLQSSQKFEKLERDATASDPGKVLDFSEGI
ncbi:MAG TPA: hypothetical protein VLE95_04755 [Chlamydiales bacterium]|nr:hypothetical protein [Chlamydiales bacterium]